MRASRERPCARMSNRVFAKNSPTSSAIPIERRKPGVEGQSMGLRVDWDGIASPDAGDAVRRIELEVLSQTAVRTDFVVLRPLGHHSDAGHVNRLKPVLACALVAELSIDAPDVAVLHREPWLDKDVAHAMGPH